MLELARYKSDLYVKLNKYVMKWDEAGSDSSQWVLITELLDVIIAALR